MRERTKVCSHDRLYVLYFLVDIFTFQLSVFICRGICIPAHDNILLHNKVEFFLLNKKYKINKRVKEKSENTTQYILIRKNLIFRGINYRKVVFLICVSSGG